MITDSTRRIASAVGVCLTDIEDNNTALGLIERTVNALQQAQAWQANTLRDVVLALDVECPDEILREIQARFGNGTILVAAERELLEMLGINPDEASTTETFAERSAKALREIIGERDNAQKNSQHDRMKLHHVTKQHEDLAEVINKIIDQLNTLACYLGFDEKYDADEVLREAYKQLNRVQTEPSTETAYLQHGEIVMVNVLYTDSQTTLVRPTSDAGTYSLSASLASTDILLSTDDIQWHTEQEYKLQELVKEHTDCNVSQTSTVVKAVNGLVDAGELMLKPERMIVGVDLASEPDQAHRPAPATPETLWHQLSASEQAFVQRVAKYGPLKHAAEPHYGPDDSALWDNPEKLGFIRSVGSYKFDIGPAYTQYLLMRGDDNA